MGLQSPPARRARPDSRDAGVRTQAAVIGSCLAQCHCANVARTFIGYRTLGGVPFAFRDNTRRSIMSYGAPREGEVVPNAGHALLGIGVPAAGATLGVFSGLAMF